MAELHVMKRSPIAQSFCCVLGPYALRLATLDQSFAKRFSRKSLLINEPCVFVTTGKQDFLVCTNKALCLPALQSSSRQMCYLPQSQTLLTSQGPHLEGCLVVDPRDTVTVADHLASVERFRWSFQSEVTAMTYGGNLAFVGCCAIFGVSLVSAWDTRSGLKKWEVRLQTSGKVDCLHFIPSQRILLVGTQQEDGWMLHSCLRSWSIDKVHDYKKAWRIACDTVASEIEELRMFCEPQGQQHLTMQQKYDAHMELQALLDKRKDLYTANCQSMGLLNASEVWDCPKYGIANWRLQFAYVHELLHNECFIYIVAHVDGEPVGNKGSQGVFVCDTQTGQVIWRRRASQVSNITSMGPLICFDVEDIENKDDWPDHQRLRRMCTCCAHSGTEVWVETLWDTLVYSMVYVEVKGFVVTAEAPLGGKGMLVARASETGVETIRSETPSSAYCLQYCASSGAILGAMHADDNYGAERVGAWDIHTLNMLFQVELLHSSDHRDWIQGLVYLPSITRVASDGLLHAVPQAPVSGHLDMAQTAVILNPSSSQSVESEVAAEDVGKLENQTALSKAILLSKLDGPAEGLPLSFDGVTIFRITRYAHSEATLQVLLESPLLNECRSRVADAGCDIIPEWGNGAKCFVPLTPDQSHELARLGIELQPHHVIALKTDLESLNSALQSMASRKRARVNVDHHASYPDACAASSFDDLSEHSDNEELQIVIAEPQSWPATDSSVGFPH